MHYTIMITWRGGGQVFKIGIVSTEVQALVIKTV